MHDYINLFQAAKVDLDHANNLDLIEKTRIKYFGKNGLINSQLKLLGKSSPEERKEIGKKLNQFKSEFLDKLSKKKAIIEEQIIHLKLEKEMIDISLPSREYRYQETKIHPISFTINEISRILSNMGLSREDGPDIENDFYNFTALNIPENHPARQMHDTFYLDCDEQIRVLRTHTSPVQIRCMQKKITPIRIFSPGRTYRCDSDITHTPMFHQVEGLVIDKHVSFSNLKWFVEEFCKEFFEKYDLKLRFRPSYFPFTEPSAEVDINCQIESGKIHLGVGEEWMEILGCGMVHPNVFKKSDLENRNEISGFAFGMGVERLAMLKYGMPDLRHFFENNLKWLNNYGFSFLD